MSDARSADDLGFVEFYSASAAERELDDPRWRRRLAAYLRQRLRVQHPELADALALETGEVLRTKGEFIDFERFFDSVPLPLLLQAISVIWRQLSAWDQRTRASRHVSWRHPELAGDWLEFVARTLIEHNLAYQLTDRAGVRYRVDRHFESMRQAALNGLADPRYASARLALESAYTDFLELPMDRLSALRNMTTAVARLLHIVTGVAAIDRALLTPLLTAARPETSDEEAYLASALRLLEGFSSWSDAMEPFRKRGPGRPPQPPLGLTVCALDIGAAMLRWLAELDRGPTTERD